MMEIIIIKLVGSVHWTQTQLRGSVHWTQTQLRCKKLKKLNFQKN